MAGLEMLERLRAALRGRYELERELGSGGMATVYRAHDERHERFVAIKVMRPEFAPTLGAERFLREIRLAAGLQHPHIVPLYDSGEAGGFLYYVMPHLDGESLRERLQRDGQLPIEEALAIAREVAEALQCAHSRGVIHRDIKPENVYLSGGHAQVLDFGIARAVSAAGGLTLTEAGVAVGTPAYMSPEQATADPRMDGRADIYALGCVLYEMLGGAPPFAGPSAQVIMARHSTEAVPSVRILRPQVTPAIESIIERMLAKLPADRFATAADLARVLTTGATTVASSPALTRMPRRAAVMAGVFALGIATVALWRVIVSEVGAESAIVGNVSIAVLPMRNLGDSTDTFFAEGLPRDVTSELTRVAGLAPRPFETVSREFSLEPDPRRLGERLSADYVLSSSLQREGQRFIVRAELMRVDDGSLVWANQVFDGFVRDLFAMQVSIARQLVAQLRGELVAQGLAFGAGQGRRDPEAYRLYQEGMFHVARANLIGAERAARLFEQAVARDSTFADAWAELAGAYDWLSQFSVRAPTDVVFQARRAAERAVALGSVRGNARGLVANYALYFEFDVDAYRRHMLRAIEENPGDASIHLLYGQSLRGLGFPDSAMREFQRAAMLNPTDAFFEANVADMYMQLGLTDSARALARRVLSVDSAQWAAHMTLAMLEERAGNLDAAVREMVSAQRAMGSEVPWLMGYVGYYYGRAGMKAEADSILRRLRELNRTTYVQAVFVATALLGLGDRAGTIDALEASFRARDRDLYWKLQYGEFEELRGEPGYEALIRQTRLDRILRKPGHESATGLNRSARPLRRSS